MPARTHYALVAALVAVVTIAAYLPDPDLYRTSPTSIDFPTSDARIEDESSETRVVWRSRPVTVALTRAVLVVPIGSRAARVTTALTLAAAIVTALTAAVVLSVSGSITAAIAAALGLAFAAGFAAEATSPVSNLAESALYLSLVGFCLSRSRVGGWTRWRSITCALAIAALGFATIVIPFYIFLGLAMAAFVRYAAPYATRAATMFIFLVPLLNGIEQYRPRRQAVNDNGLAAAVAEALPNALPANAHVIAADGRTNRVHGYWEIGMPAPRLIAPVASVIKGAHEKGQQVLAFVSSIRSLEARDLHFDTVRLLETTVSVQDYLRQLPFRSIVVAGSGPGAASNSSSAPFHGSIGIVGPFGVRPLLERTHALPVDLRLEAGDPIGSTMLAPVPIRVLTDDSGIIIDIDRRYVVKTSTGRALAVVTPGGRVSAAHSMDAAARFAVPVDAPEFQMARLRMPAGN